MLLLERYGRRGRMMKSRQLARAAALINGYFWLPCKLCGRPFAGFEAFTDRACVVTEEGMFGVCSRASCKEEGRRQYERYVAPTMWNGRLKTAEQVDGDWQDF